MFVTTEQSNQTCYKHGNNIPSGLNINCKILFMYEKTRKKKKWKIFDRKLKTTRDPGEIINRTIVRGVEKMGFF